MPPTEQQRRSGFEAMRAIWKRYGFTGPSCVFCENKASGLSPAHDQPDKVDLTCDPCGRRSAMRVAP